MICRLERGPKKQILKKKEEKQEEYIGIIIIFMKFKTGKATHGDKIRIAPVGVGVIWDSAGGTFRGLEMIRIFIWEMVT